jgi:hypothetical protein
MASRTGRKTYFNKKWCQIEKYKDWFCEVPDDRSSFSCSCCLDKSLKASVRTLSNSGEKQVRQHQETLQHKSNLEKWRKDRAEQSSISEFTSQGAGGTTDAQLQESQGVELIKLSFIQFVMNPINYYR